MHEVKEIYKTILTRQNIAVDFHCQMKNLFDFLGLRGYKRWHEKQMFEEMAEQSGVSRYFINHHNYIIDIMQCPDTNYIPQEIRQKDRLTITDMERKKATRTAFVAWCDWEIATKVFLEGEFAKLARLGKAADCNKVNELIKAVDQELKEVQREYISVMSDEQYHTTIEPERQDKMHDKYAEETKKIGIYIC